jgi:release factor glutamine methyltransferase
VTRTNRGQESGVRSQEVVSSDPAALTPHPPTTIDAVLRQGASRLSPRSSSPRLDAEVLLAHLLGIGRASLLAHSTSLVDAEMLSQYDALIERRYKGEPIAYLTGHKEFYGLDLHITPDVLVPRPETESAVEACLEVIPIGETSQLADIGTGCGAILVAICKQRPLVKAFGTDISPAAIEVAAHNCRYHGIEHQANLLVGHLLQPLPGRVNVIVANLPYVAPGEAAEDVATWEPQVAVFGGGDDGTALIREFLTHAPDYLLPGGTVVMEVAHSQGKIVSELARAAFPGARVEVRKDLAGYDRIVVIKTP